MSYNWLKTGIGEPRVSSEDYLIKEFIQTFEERLIWLIWSRGLSPSKLAKDLELSSSTTITYWCEGKRTPNELNLKKLCDFFGVTENWLKPNSS